MARVAPEKRLRHRLPTKHDEQRDEVVMEFDSSSTVMEFKNNFPIPDDIYWDSGRFETKSGFSESEETADMYTNLLAGFIVGLKASGRTTDFEVDPYNRNP